MAKVGRPTKYDPSMCKTAIEVMKQGFSKEAVAGHLGISKDTLYRWVKEHEEFSDAIKKGLEQSRIFWEDIGIQGVLAGAGNATMWIFNMKNRFRDEWSDTQKQEISGDGINLTLIHDGYTVSQHEQSPSTSEGSVTISRKVQGVGVAQEGKENSNGTN